MAAAPFPIDLGAPVFGASMAAAAASFGSMVAFEQGVDVMPTDAIALVHAGERIVTRNDNREIMAAVRNGSGGGAARGDVHLNYSPTLEREAKPFRQQLYDHATDLKVMLKRMHRNGELRWQD